MSTTQNTYTLAPSPCIGTLELNSAQRQSTAMCETRNTMPLIPTPRCSSSTAAFKPTQIQHTRSIPIPILWRDILQAGDFRPHQAFSQHNKSIPFRHQLTSETYLLQFAPTLPSASRNSAPQSDQEAEMEAALECLLMRTLRYGRLNQPILRREAVDIRTSPSRQESGRV